MIKKEFINKQFLIFISIGIINTFTGSIFSIIYSKLLQPNLAFGLGFLTGTVISYLLNSKYTFKNKLDIKKYFSFLINVVPNFIIQNLAVFLFYNILDYSKIIAYLIAAVIGIPLTFILLKYVTFKTKSS